MNKILIILFFFLISGCFLEDLSERKDAEIYLSQYNFLERTYDTLIFKGIVQLYKPDILHEYEYCRYDFHSFGYEISMQDTSTNIKKNKLTEKDILDEIEWSIDYTISALDAVIVWDESNFNEYDCIWIGATSKFKRLNNSKDSLLNASANKKNKGPFVLPFNFNLQNIWQPVYLINNEPTEVINLNIVKKNGLISCNNCTYPNPGYLEIDPNHLKLLK